MSEADAVKALEEALLARARVLADEYRARGRESRQRILQEAHERLRQREEEETLRAKALAERIKRRRIQAGELKMRAELDRLCWTRMEAALAKARHQLARFSEDEARYLPVLRQFLEQAAKAIECDELVAQVNARDLKRLTARWEAWSNIPAKRVHLSPQPIECTGGVMVQSRDERIRMDNTFEGRLERLQNKLYQTVLDQLFAAAQTHRESQEIGIEPAKKFM